MSKYPTAARKPAGIRAEPAEPCQPRRRPRAEPAPGGRAAEPERQPSAGRAEPNSLAHAQPRHG